MTNPTKEEIKLLAGEVTDLILAGENNKAIEILKPILDTKCPFVRLDFLGREIGSAGINKPGIFFKFFDELIDYNAMGGFVIVSRALTEFLENNFDLVMEKSKEYIIKGDVWYVCDIIGERSIGQGLVDYSDETIPVLERFLEDENRWVRRSAGVAVHFFSKRVQNDEEKTKKLLNLIEPHIGEKQIDAIKGIGWGLKTIGKYHPGILLKFLIKQLKNKKKISRVMMRKATTYLDENEKSEVNEYV